MSTTRDPAGTVVPATAMSRTDRLDRLPFTARHGRLLVGSGIGWALDAMDVGLISFIMAALAKEWSLDTGTLSWIASLGFVGMAIGASVGGLLADRFGRRNVFAVTLLIYGIATGASALVTGVAMLLVLRVLVGLGLGAELPVASTLVSEYAPARIRGRVVVLLEAFWAVGWIFSALIGYFIVPGSFGGWEGWRWALLTGILPALYAVVVRRGLPESVRFLESKGRYAQAESAVRSFEASAGVAPVPSPVAGPEVALEVAPQVAPQVAPRQSVTGVRSLFAPGLRVRTVALWLVWFGVNFAYYGAFVWIPTLLVAQGFPLVRSFEFTLWITLAQLPGYAAAATLIEVLGRRATLAGFLLGSAVAAFGFGTAGSDAAILAWGCALSFFNLGAWGALYAVTPEVYPTSVRGSGTGAAAAFGRIASIAAPLAVPWLRDLGGGANHVLFGAFAVAFVLAMACSLLLPDLTRRSLDTA